MSGVTLLRFGVDNFSEVSGFSPEADDGAEPYIAYPEAEAAALEAVAEAAIRSPQGFHDLDRAIERLDAVRRAS